MVWGQVEQPSEDSSSSIVTPLNLPRNVAFQNSSSSSELRVMLESSAAAAPRPSWSPVGASMAALPGGVAAQSPGTVNGVTGVVDEILQDMLTRQNLWSMGSSGHRERKCKPCHYVHATQGCKNGLQCEFCHLPHTESRSGKPSKLCMSKRLHCKQVALAIEDLFTSHPDVYKEASALLSSESTYLANILQARINEVSSSSSARPRGSMLVSLDEPPAPAAAAAAPAAAAAAPRNARASTLHRPNIQSL